MENKIIALENLCHIENAFEEDGFINIEGYAAHYNKANLNNEVVDSRSFTRFFNMYANKELEPHVNWQHTDTVVGPITEIVSREDGLWISAKLNKGVKIVDEMIAPNILAGTLNKFSTEGYIYGGYDGIVENKDGSYYVKDFLLTSVSIVRTSADPQAVFTVKNFIDEWRENKKRLKWYLL